MQKQLFSFIILIVIVAAVPVTLYLSQNKTSFQQKASEYDLGDEDTLMENFGQYNKGENEQRAHASYKNCRKTSTRQDCIQSIFAQYTIFFRNYSYFKKYFASRPSSLPSSLPSAVPTLSSNTGATGGIILTVSLCPHGLGSCGDNVSESGGNLDPLHKTRQASITLYDSGNQLVGTYELNVLYQSEKKYFSGTVTTGSIKQGNYRAKIQMTGYLATWIPGILSLSPSQTQDIPKVALVGGDINHDNAINNQDFNIFSQCYPTITNTCSEDVKAAADINDDSVVNQIDYNLFLREMSSHKGAN
jgi:hypothetical protein